MSDTTPGSPTASRTTASGAADSERATTVGLVAAVVGVVAGVAMALQRRVVECADGTFFSEGTTDFRCFEHPQLLEGTAVVAISVAVGALILLVSTSIRDRAKGAGVHDA